MENGQNPWTIEDSKRVYGIGDDFREYHFLDIDENGFLSLQINNHSITIKEVLQILYQRLDQLNVGNLDQTPSVTLRFPQLVTFQINKIFKAFKVSMKDLNYNGVFSAVYPIKVNQQRHAIEAVLHDREKNYGLEVGTKAEFLIALSALKERKEHLIMLNGVKDVDFLELAVKKSEEGYNLIISIESLRELKTLLEITPDLGNLKLCLRIKPYIPSSGHWSFSAGRNSKFGLSIGEFEEVVEYLETTGKKRLIHAIHSHIGSQITSLKDFKELSKYLCNFYNYLHEKGFVNLTTIDFGGGLPIDYEGLVTRSQPDTFVEYARNIVEGIEEVITPEKHPNILIEAGRAITALSSMVIVQILEVKNVFPKESQSLENVYKNWERKIERISTFNTWSELWTEYLGLDARDRTLAGDIATLKQHEFLIGRIRKKFRERIASIFTEEKFNQFLFDEHLRDLLTKAQTLAICNFSVFNSVCDYVLVNQYFPIFPIENLNNKPETIVRMVDITCDSDGEISSFKTKTDSENVFTKDGFPLLLKNANIILKGIPVPALRDLNESYFAIALTGAYQDIIEFDHNLLGDLPDAEVRVNDDGEWEINWMAPPESSTLLIEKVGYSLIEEDTKIGQTSYAKDTWNRPKGTIDRDKE
ncbi:MAG: biosynthetic arginine decarboxylase [Candidatus Heimdallarchaeota archaeon]|nr:MAG: biosynthetic arginine decarboxylase [Candidatus Heimdallarchaeota archaeon]